MKAPPELYLAVTRTYHPLPDPGRGLLVASDAPGHPNLHLQLEPGDERERLVPSGERTLPVASTPLGIVIRHDTGGDERWQASLLEPSGEVRQLTTDPDAMHLGLVPAPDGRRVGLSHNPGGGTDLALSVLDLESGEISEWVPPGRFISWGDWRPDGLQASAIRALGSGRSEAFLIEPGQPMVPVLAGAHAVHQLFWTDGGRLLAVTDHGSEFAGLAEVDPAALDRPLRWLHHPDQDIVVVVPAPGGATAAVAVRAGFYDQLLLLNLADGSVIEHFDLPPGVVYSDNVDSADGQLAWREDGRLLVAWETPTQPAQVYELRTGLPPVRLTSPAKPVPPVVEPEPTAYRSFDGLEIPAFHYKVDSSPRPTVLWIHGGPESQFAANFSPPVQLLCARGFNVLAPNVRGSSGYGVTYLHLDDREKRWDSVRDACEGARHLLKEAGTTAVAVMGGSYGGFITLAVLTEEPELWAAAVDIVGIADWRSFFKNTSGWRRAQRTIEYGDPELPEDAEFLDRFSPLGRAERIRVPLLVIHGRNDPRVPLSEAEQICAATGAELLVFDDEGHGLMRHANRVRGYGRAADFLAEKVLGF